MDKIFDYDKVKDSGQRQEFEGGAVRDTNEGKPRFDLIPPLALKRVAKHYANGAKKYSEWNWSKGMPYSRFYESALRHLYQFGMGHEDEDHLAAVIFNCLAIIHFQEMKRIDLNDMFKCKMGYDPQAQTNIKTETGPLPPEQVNSR